MPDDDPPPARDAATRRTDALDILTTPAVDVWVATASATGAPHLVPVSLAWVGERVVIAVAASSVTARNLEASERARLGVGPTRDVVMIDAVLERSVGVDDDRGLGDDYAAQADWDPRGLVDYVFLVLRPERMQAWRESNELVGRTLMRAGE
ncbi:hypothetical protein GCM10022237_47360 [Nocardioides ginsengisoli]|uniref:Pyridoxamine 5'-phosphate oxidase family protein n=1 Tax=Nocardioides ginsengisoli TaxID=363868 RepID=A0ABW3W1R5_9ACTN